VTRSSFFSNYYDSSSYGSTFFPGDKYHKILQDVNLVKKNPCQKENSRILLLQNATKALKVPSRRHFSKNTMIHMVRKMLVNATPRGHHGAHADLFTWWKFSNRFFSNIFA
jgi:hypothetical protein